eukprot:COSAG02_NODE_795_length_17133_cov_6.577727_9_plen_80_part_00
MTSMMAAANFLTPIPESGRTVAAKRQIVTAPTRAMERGFMRERKAWEDCFHLHLPFRPMVVRVFRRLGRLRIGRTLTRT